MKKEKQSVKIVTSPFILFGVIFAIVGCIGCLLFFAFYPSPNPLDLWEWIGACIMFGGMPILLIISMAIGGFLSVITIDKLGIKTSVCGIFPTKKIAWKELNEIDYYERLVPFVFFCKAGSIQGMNYDQMIKKKDAIQVQLTRKVYQAIKRFTEMPITNLTEDRIALLRLEKKK